MRAVLIVAGKEIRECLRNRWLVAATLLLAGLALTLTFLGSAPIGNVGVSALDVMIVSLSSLTIFLIPLIALLISHDAIVGEIERGTMLLLLTYPVARWQVVIGKFVGHLGVLAFSTLVGYGAAALALMWTPEPVTAQSWLAFGTMIGSSVLLGAVFRLAGAEELSSRRRLLAGAMQTLSDRERQIVSERRLKENPTTLEHLSQRFGISRERVRQIEVRAFEKLQKSVKNAVIEQRLSH